MSAAAASSAIEAACSKVGQMVAIKGDIQSREELFIDGEVEGTLVLQQRLIVGPNGKIRASVKAKEVVVQGSIHGNVHAAEKIILRKDSTLVGDIRTSGIVIDDGAYFKGSIDIVRDAKEAPRPAGSVEPALTRTASSVA
jgi:cytoskeletal protein CcmA (bactofilin family)